MLREEERKKERKENSLEIAKKMLDKNKDIEEICEFTGLSQEEINSLKEDN